jgi:hypothetical protein
MMAGCGVEPVMPGLEPGIHVLDRPLESKARMAAT